ncbi:MAG: DUF6079 family protein [Pyrinomonadaceae bacterium]
MKQIQEKVRDIVEVRTFSNVHDFSADPAETLDGYHFTDITADMMAKWLDAVMNIRRGQGAAVALAGFRGVGKSHFLAVLAAILSKPELRSRIKSDHISACAKRLADTEYAVAFVRRGSLATLLEEFKAAIAGNLPLANNDLSNSFNDLLLKASEATRETPFILLIDTAVGRETRVSRDDGMILSEIAQAAKSFGIFVGLALDDDIAGADGANRAISASYVIDYLDHEHLYKVVETHIFAKHERALPILHDIYKHYSKAMPGFRWSEQRFTALYPLHPATLEVAPLIRLHLQDFALLGFAAEAGVRILGRPAHSLIGLDEVFDAVESRLRLVTELNAAFTAFDILNQEVIGKTPVNLRLQAKLILKGLFMLSLDGKGSTASEIAGAMLVFDDVEAGKPGIVVNELLTSIFEALPDAVSRVDSDSSEPKYCFQIGQKGVLDGAMDDAASTVSLETVFAALLARASQKFSDMTVSRDGDSSYTNCSVEWRGAIRHGEIFWALAGFENSTKVSPATDQSDWSICVTFDHADSSKEFGLKDDSSIEWRLGELRDEDIGAIKRLHLLETNPELREGFKEKLSAEAQICSLEVESIWERIFLSESRLIVGKAEYRLSDDARSAHTLSQLFTTMLEPVFESRFPAHPNFSKPFGVKEAAKLTGQFFGGSGANNLDVQKLAELFALPLGLVELRDDIFVPVSAEILAKLSVVVQAFDGLEFGTDATITLEELSSRMRAAPIGLTREAQHIVLTALVAQGQYEFVTFSGNRINKRSLDLQIMWDDVAGVAKPFVEIYSSERLRDWAILITGNTQIRSLEKSEDRLIVIDTLAGWLANWKEARFLEAFDALPDENLNSSIWRIAANLRKTFGALADCVDALVQNITPLDQCLHNIADLFSDSEAEYEKKKNDLIVLRYFTQGAEKRDEISKYLSLCEITADKEVEMLRRALLEKTGSIYYAADPRVNAEIDRTWREFKQKYTDYYVGKHDAVMRSGESVEKLNALLSSDQWSVFQSFSDLAWFDSHFKAAVKRLIRNIKQLKCSVDTRESLSTKPFCSCSFNLATFERRHDLSSRLEIIINQGLLFFRASLNENDAALSVALDALAGNSNRELANSVRQALSNSSDAKDLLNLSSQQTYFLASAIKMASERKPETAGSKVAELEDFTDLLPLEVSKWESEIDKLEFATTNRT